MYSYENVVNREIIQNEIVEFCRLCERFVYFVKSFESFVKRLGFYFLVMGINKDDVEGW